MRVNTPHNASGSGSALAHRLAGLDWQAAEAALDKHGVAPLKGLLTPDECQTLIDKYDMPDLFRNKVIMQSHGFGQGEYQYFAYPLPDPVQTLRETVYPHLAPIANRWYESLGFEPRYPADLPDFLQRCHEASQLRPTPLMLRYRPGDYNCLHQDLYGEHLFPLQLTVLLSQPGIDFEGGALVITEQRPRMQSRPEVLSLQQGDAVIFPVQHRPVQGKRGFYRVTMRHGVSRVLTGERYALGVIFHDEK